MKKNENRLRSVAGLICFCLTILVWLPCGVYSNLNKIQIARFNDLFFIIIWNSRILVFGSQSSHL